jgi:two-component system, cell cycle response regulator DivK
MDRTPTLLLVDDDEDERIIYAALLQYFGYHVVEAQTGAAGIERAVQLRPDLILMDIRLPDVDGFAVTQILRSRPETARIPILAMSLYDITTRDAQAAGCDDFLPKPFPPSALVERVRKALGQAAPEPPAEP